ncbi:MAG: hypothetical protein ACYCZY_04995 [Lacisediminihabitans sp.]
MSSLFLEEIPDLDAVFVASDLMTADGIELLWAGVVPPSASDSRHDGGRKHEHDEGHRNQAEDT